MIGEMGREASGPIRPRLSENRYNRRVGPEGREGGMEEVGSKGRGKALGRIDILRESVERIIYF